jgi:hypothetical protein
LVDSYQFIDDQNWLIIKQVAGKAPICAKKNRQQAQLRTGRSTKTL